MTDRLKMADSIGYRAAVSGKAFALQTLKSQAGYYFGTATADDEPYTRESVQYWLTDAAQRPLVNRSHIKARAGPNSGPALVV